MQGRTYASPYVRSPEFPPRQKVDTLSLKKALEKVMQQMENPKGGNNYPARSNPGCVVCRTYGRQRSQKPKRIHVRMEGWHPQTKKHYPGGRAAGLFAEDQGETGIF